MSNIFKVIFVIIGSIIGAGFASGKEIYIFFGQHGVYGFIGAIISALIISVIIYKVFEILRVNNIENYHEFLKIIGINKNINILDAFINVFLIVSFYIMVSGFSAYVNQQFGINNIISSIIFSSICFIVFSNNINGITKTSIILVPILIISIIILGYKCNEWNTVLSETNYGFWIIDSIIYASYNSVLLVPVLITMKHYIRVKKYNFIISIFSMIILICLTFSVLISLNKINILIDELEMPMVYVVTLIGNKYQYLYGAIIGISIFTSAISAGYSFLKNMTKNKKSYTQLSVFMCISSCIISSISFSGLIKALYPLFGIIGIGQILLILFYKKNYKAIEKKR